MLKCYRLNSSVYAPHRHAEIECIVDPQIVEILVLFSKQSGSVQRSSQGHIRQAKITSGGVGHVRGEIGNLKNLFPQINDYWQVLRDKFERACKPKSVIDIERRQVD